MKRNFLPAIKSMFVVVLLNILQLKAMAAETGVSEDHTNFFSQPWLWIAIIVVAIMVFASPFDHKNEVKIIMKKKKSWKKQ